LSTTVFLAVIAAALLHAVWNALVKGSADKHLGMTAVVLGQVPAALLALAVVPTPAPESWPWLAIGIALHFGYQFFLLLAYRAGDLTQVYPIARGSAPLIVAAVSLGFLGVALAPLELLAVLVIGAGIMSLSLVRRQDGLRNPRAAALALTTGGFIAAYSLIDGTGARLSGSPVAFFAWIGLGNAALFAALIAAIRPGVIARIPSRGMRAFAIGGTASFVAYAMVVWAFTQAPIALVSALRETSIAFALLIGVTVLGERLDLARVASTMATLLGAALLRLAR
jgi:drug/metabolite transporter (DMT)-like permease